MNAFKRKCLLLTVALASGTALGTSAAMAQNLETTGPSLSAQRFEQIDENGVDLINGTFNLEGPSLSYGEGEGRLSADLRWTGRTWDLNIPSIWRDDDNGLFVNTGRTIEEFELHNGLWEPTRGNTSTVICTFFNQERTQMYRCDYRGHDGTTVRFDAFNPVQLPVNPYAPELGNLNARFGLAIYPDGRGNQVTASGVGQFNAYMQGGVFSLGNGGVGGPGSWDTSVNLTLSVIVADGTGSAGRAVGALTFTTPNNNYNNRKTRNIFRPRSTTQTITDPGGQPWSYTFNGDGEMTSMRRPGAIGNTITLTYDSNHRVTSYSNASGTWNYSYSSNNGIGTTIRRDPSFLQTRVTYIKKHGNVRTVLDALNRLTTYGYDSANRLTSIVYPEGNSIIYGYDARGNIQTETRNPKSAADPVLTRQAGYPLTCPNGGQCNQPDYIIDANQNRTDYTYAGPRVTSITRPAPIAGGIRPQTRFTYTPMIRRLRRSTDGVMVTQPTAMPLLTMISDCATQASCIGTADEVRTTIDYGQNDPNSEVVWMPMLVQIGTGDGAVYAERRFTYTPAGDIASVDGPQSGTADTTYSRYDAMHRLTGTIDPDPDQGGPLPSRAERHTYRPDGLIQLREVGTVTDPSDAAWAAFAPRQMTATAYDNAGRTTMVASAAGGVTDAVTQYNYYPVNRPWCTAVRMNRAAFPTISSTGVISGGALPAACSPGSVGADGPDRISQTSYDAAGQITQLAQGIGTPQAQAYASYTYTANGMRQTITDANGNRAEYGYDGHDRQVRWYMPSQLTVGATDYGNFEELHYDNNGNRVQLRRRDGSLLNFQYDALNRVTAKLVPERPDLGIPASATRDVYYSYDLLGRQLSARFDSLAGEGVSNLYDALGRVTSTTTSMSGVSRTIGHSYDPAGNVKRVTHPDGQFFYYEGNLTGQLTGLFANIVSPLMTFSYNDMGQVATQTTSANARTTTTMSRDSMGRLSQMAFNMEGSSLDHTIALGYNAATQIVSRTGSNDLYAYRLDVNVDRPYAVNGLNQYSTAGSASFSYDLNGNLIADGTSTYLYDVENRLISAAGGTSAALTYDPLGRLFQLTSGASATQFLYDDDNLTGEYDATGAMVRRYVHGRRADQPLVYYIGPTTADPRYFHANYQGSIIAITDPFGTVQTTNSYDSWGVPGFKASGRFRYTGQVWLAELGMYYYKARFYSPSMGRYLQTDPIGYEDQMNLYAYGANDPVNTADPTGKSVYVLGAQPDIDAFLALIHRLTGITVVVGRDGRLTATSLPRHMNTAATDFNNSLNSSDFLIALPIQNSPIVVDRFGTGQIDVSDLNVMADQNLQVAQGQLSHIYDERSYAWQHPNGDLTYRDAHRYALRREAATMGASSRDDADVAGIYDRRPGGSVTFRYRDSAGNIVSSFRFNFDASLNMVNPPPAPR